MNKEQVELLRKNYLGKNVHVIINFLDVHLDRWGTVTNIDDRGHIYGTWGSEYVNPESDYIKIGD